MKTLLVALALLSSISTHAAILSRITTDQATYQVGSKAVVFIHTDHPIDNPELEYYSGLKVGEQEVSVVELSNHLAVAFPSRFTVAGEQQIALDLFLQDKATHRTLLQGISFYKAKNFELEAQLAKETDSEARAILLGRISLNNELIEKLEAERSGDRTLVELNQATFSVLPAVELVRPLSGVFTSRASHENGIYAPGEVATFYSKLLTGFTGPDGPREVVFRGAVDSVPLLTQFAVDEYFFTTNFPLSVGSHAFTSTLLIRSKAQADLLRLALAQAAGRRADFVGKRNGANLPEEIAYYDFKISQLNQAIGNLKEQLEAILLEVGTDTIPFTVTN